MRMFMLRLGFGWLLLERLERALGARQVTLKVSARPDIDISLHGANDPNPDCDDGFSLRRNGTNCAIHAENNRGLMYGIPEVLSSWSRAVRW